MKIRIIKYNVNKYRINEGDFMNKSISYLSPMEYEMMMIFWNLDKPLTAAEVLENRKEGTWAKNSIHPLINTLLHKEFLRVCGTKKSGKVNSRLYESNISMAEYVSSQIATVYENKKERFNIGCFMSGMLGENRTSDEKIISELEDWIKDHHENTTDEDM